MREPAPPYPGEGPRALWHVSEDATIERFEPHTTVASDETLVWAVDTRHLPLFWFRRDCPRATFWAGPHTTPEDAELLHGSARVHAFEGGWLERLREARVLAYRLPEESFSQDPEVAGYWVSRAAVEPMDVVEAGDLLANHAAAEIELRMVPNLWPLWNRVIASTLEFSGIRLRNAAPSPGKGDQSRV
ncbi:MAG: hypothetical protein QOE36_1437 [Gaiellaceae bacterium]|nr:hypothetical protein [Gaiellaceae bacterium]